MMSHPKSLILMRHAEAAVADRDHDRTLTKKGEEQAREIAISLSGQEPAPEAILCSDARRAIGTWDHLKKHLKSPREPIFSASLYLAGIGSLLGELMTVAESVASVLLIGHNPGLETLVQFMSGEQVMLTEATVVILTHPGGTWLDDVAEPHSWKLSQILRPSP